MPVIHSVPSDVRSPGTYLELKLGASARLQPGVRRIALVAQKLAGGTATNLVPVKVFSDIEADGLFGVGSELALMARWALKASKRVTGLVELLCVPMAPGAGTARVQTFTITGTATAGGDIVIRIAGRTIRVGVDLGDAQNTIATAMDLAIDTLKAELPVTSAAATNIVTCTANQANVNGADIKFEVTSSVAGVTVATAQTVPAAGVVDITTALDALATWDPIDFIAIANHAATDVTDYDAHLDSMWLPGQKYWRWSVMAEIGSLATAQALATAANDFRQVVISSEGWRNTPGEIAAYIAFILASRSDTAIPFNDEPLPDLYLPADTDLPLKTEVESALAGGLLILGANEAKTQGKIIRAVTTQVTFNGVPFYDVLDLTISRTAANVFRQVDIAWRTEIGLQQKKSPRVKALARSVTWRRLKLLEKAELIQNLDAHASELIVENDVGDPSALVIAFPTTVIPPLNKLIGVGNLILE